MRTAKEAFLHAVENFPKWMSIRKRPTKTNGGKYLQSILDEQTSIKDKLDEYIKSFFLLSYVGRESEIIDYAWIAQVGDVDINTLTTDLVKITTDARTFISERPVYGLYQDGFVILWPEKAPENHMFSYALGEYPYSIKMIYEHIWNIIDEFAMMSGLERYENETNAQLMRRCFMAFRNPTNCTETGLKHAIENAIQNFQPITDEDIVIEKPDKDNMFLEDEEFGTVYERLVQFNKDIFRTKQWDMATWEHNFAKIDFIPNKWDEQIKVYQDGVGQMGDLSISMSDEAGQEMTAVEVTAYEASRVLIDRYIRRHSVKKEIPLKLARFNDELKSKKVGYRITAFPVKMINPNEITLQCASKVNGQSRHFLSDIIVDQGELTKSEGGMIDAGCEYELTFLPKSQYSDMGIYHVNLIKDGKVQSLLKEDAVFKFKNDVLHNSNVAACITKIEQFKNSTNTVLTDGGFTVGAEEAYAEMVIDVTGMDNKRINLPTTCGMTNVTSNFSEITGDGFTHTDDGEWVSSGDVAYATLSIDLRCNEVSFEIPEEESPENQGSYIMTVQVNGEIIESRKSSKPLQYQRSFNETTNVHIEIQKIGDNPVVVRDIMISAYKVSCWTEEGHVVRTTRSLSLPDVGGRKNALHVRLDAYTNLAPVLECIHIGASVASAAYRITGIKADGIKNVLDISSDCYACLYKVEDGELRMISDDYTTQSTFSNNTDHNVFVEIDTMNFLNIRSASMAIQSTTRNGRVVNYLNFSPGESVSDIIIDGTSFVVKEERALGALLEIMPGDKTYVSSGINGFIVSRRNGKEEIIKISRDMLAPSADCFTYRGTLSEGIIPSFVVDEKNNVVTNAMSFERQFETTYLILSGNTQYVAYNETALYQEELKGVKIVNTFAPLLDMNQLLLYQIDKGVSQKNTIEFIKTYDGNEELSLWSLGLKDNGIRIKVAFDFDNENEYKLNTGQITESFAISNNIALADNYIVNGEEMPLSRFIVTPPDNMRITYETQVNDTEDARQAYFYAKEDRFNKLFHSNVTNIMALIDTENNIDIPESDYQLLSEAGIIVWKNDQYVDHYIMVAYEYKKPKYITYKDISSLYEMIGYSTDAYKVITKVPLVLDRMKNGDFRKLNFGDVVPDKITVHCTNDNFQATIENGGIRTTLVGTNNTATAKTGYYYDGGEEYYFFESVNSESIDRMNNVEMHYVRHVADSLSLIQQSSNFVRDTIFFNGSHSEELCHADFDLMDSVSGVSDLNAITACDSYGHWTTFNTRVSLVPGHNGLGIQFQAGEGGYAILDITAVAKENAFLTLKADDTLKVRVLQELKIGDNSMARSVFGMPIGELMKKGDFLTYSFKGVIDEYRYYLLVTGSGTIDDIVATDEQRQQSAEDVHTKNLTALGFDLDEKAEQSFEHRFDFDAVGAITNGLEVNGDGVITTGSNVDWGLTRIYTMQDEPQKCIPDNIIYKNNAFYSSTKEGSIRTPTIFIPNKSAVTSVVVKINDIIAGEFKNFDLHILTSNDENASFREIAADVQVNYAEVSASRIASYIQIVVDMPANRVINNIEVYVKYAETKNGTLHVSRNTYGTLKTKIYDATYVANLQPVRIDGTISSVDNMRLFMRGLREDDDKTQWSEWYECDFDDALNIIDGHPFNGYRHYQFNITLYGEDTAADIRGIICKVV